MSLLAQKPHTAVKSFQVCCQTIQNSLLCFPPTCRKCTRPRLFIGDDGGGAAELLCDQLRPATHGPQQATVEKNNNNVELKPTRLRAPTALAPRHQKTSVLAVVTPTKARRRHFTCVYASNSTKRLHQHKSLIIGPLVPQLQILNELRKCLFPPPFFLFLFFSLDRSMRTQTAARREEESVGLPRHAGCFRPFGPLSPHVAAHILTNEDKCLRVLATFQGSFPQINHSQFYPCPLGRLAGVPGCGCNEGHVVNPPPDTHSLFL